MADSDEFDWDNRSDLVVREARAIAAYFNPHGEIVIRQQGSVLENDDPFIFMPVETAKILVKKLNALIAEAKATSEN